MASSDLEQYALILMKRLVMLKKLSLRNCGQEPTLKTLLNKIDEVILINELLKLELEIQCQEQTDNLLKELYEPLEKDKDLEHLEENSPPICLK